ncbi:hypothetical protein [Streptomyces sp. NRRL F-2664]|uniref:hypothetical protein n=1 Tax=Streptomyces sp. NRRL F-2664 TaxID=1463842 RepID=UPI00131D3AB8|nr:hypothetical protein [Streptomyces sp. NRRL F-2664]
MDNRPCRGRGPQGSCGQSPEPNNNQAAEVAEDRLSFNDAYAAAPSAAPDAAIPDPDRRTRRHRQGMGWMIRRLQQR